VEGSSVPIDLAAVKKAEKDLAYYRVNRFVLCPPHWKKYTALTALNWQRVKFDKHHHPSVPNNKHGVYSFVVEPEIADHPSVKYLLYVGKAEKLSFHARFYNYLREKKRKKPRDHIVQMTTKWPKHLYFYWAEITNGAIITDVEDQLLEAFLPPHNRDFPATVRTPIRRIFG
jgi:hypothetical protein